MPKRTENSPTNHADNKKMKTCPITSDSESDESDDIYESYSFEQDDSSCSEDESLLKAHQDTQEDTEQTNNLVEDIEQYVDERDYEDEEKYYDTNYFIQNPFYQRDSHECLDYSDNEYTALCDILIVLADTLRERLFMKTIKFPPKQTSLRRNFCLTRSFSIPNVVIKAIQIDSKKQLLFVYGGDILNILNLLTNEIVFESAIERHFWHDFRLSRDNSIIAIDTYCIFKFSNNFDNFDSPVWKNEISGITGLTIELDTSNQKQDLIYAAIDKEKHIMVVSEFNGHVLKTIRIRENITKDLGYPKIVIDGNKNIILFSKVKYRVLSKEGNVLAKLKKHRTEYITSVVIDEPSDNIIICQATPNDGDKAWISLHYPNGELIIEQETRPVLGACKNNSTGELYAIEFGGYEIGNVIAIYK